MFLQDPVIFWQVVQEHCFAIDILVVFFSEFKDPKTGDMCRKPTKIALNYLKTTFIIDLLAFFPFFDVFNVYLAHEDAD